MSQPVQLQSASPRPTQPQLAQPQPALRPSISPTVSQSVVRLGMILLTLVAFGWRLDRLSYQSLWRDEVDAIWFATRHLPDTLAMFIQTAQNGPLYFLGLRPWFALMGSSEFALRLPSALAGALCVPLLWQVARRLLPPVYRHDPDGATMERGPSWAPALAALFFAANPYQLWYAQEGKMYALITLLALLATWFWWQGIERGGARPWIAYWFTVTVGMYSHLLFILIFPLHFVWFWIAWPQSKYHWRGYAGALAGLTLPYLPMLVWQWEFLTSTQPMTLFRFTPLTEALHTLIMNHAQGFTPNIPLLWVGPVFFLAAVGLALGWGEIGPGHPSGSLTLAPWRRYWLVVSWVLIPVATIYLLSLRQPVFTDRYVLWIAPALMMLMALGVVAVRTHALWLPQGLAAALVIYVVAFWLYGGWQQKILPLKYELRSGVHFVDQRRTPDELLILQIPHLSWAYGYYTSDQGPRPFEGQDERLGHWLDGVWTNQGWPDDMAWADVEMRMAQATAGQTTIWLLRSEPEMWDSRRLLERWLDENGTIIDSADFVGVQARQYRLDRGEP